VADAVDAMPGQSIIFENPMNEGFEVEHLAMASSHLLPGEQECDSENTGYCK